MAYLMLFLFCNVIYYANEMYFVTVYILGK